MPKDDPLVKSDAGHSETNPGMGVVFKPATTGNSDTLNMHAPLKAGGGGRQEQKSILSNKSDVFDVGKMFQEDHVESGTIVTDKRHHHMGLGGALKGAAKEWITKFQDTLEKIEYVDLPAPTMAPPEKRKEIIAEATKHGTLVPHNDHAVVVEKLKTLSHDAEKITGKPYQIIKPSAQSTPTWSAPITPTLKPESIPVPIPKKETPPHSPAPVFTKQPLDMRGFAVAPAVERKIDRPIDAYVRKPEIPKPTTPTPTVKTTSSPTMNSGHLNVGAMESGVAPEVTTRTPLTFSKPDPVPPPVPVAEIITDTRWSTPEKEIAPIPAPEVERHEIHDEIQKEITVEEEIPREPVVPIAPIPEELPPSPPVMEPSPLASRVPVRARRATAAASPEPGRSLFPVFLILFFVILGAVAGIGAALYTHEKPASIATPLSSPSLLTTDTTLTVSWATTNTVLTTSLQKAIANAGDGISHIQFTDAFQDPTAATIMEVLAPHTEGSWRRALQADLALGSVSTSARNEPYIVLRSNAFDVAFAGMLAWEPFIAADLGVFFGANDPSSASSRGFVDAISQNAAIRILYGTDGRERIVYAFVNQTTLVITTSSEALSVILGQLGE